MITDEAHVLAEAILACGILLVAPTLLYYAVTDPSTPSMSKAADSPENLQRALDSARDEAAPLLGSEEGRKIAWRLPYFQVASTAMNKGQLSKLSGANDLVEAWCSGELSSSGFEMIFPMVSCQARKVFKTARRSSLMALAATPALVLVICVGAWRESDFIIDKASDKLLGLHSTAVASAGGVLAGTHSMSLLIGLLTLGAGAITLYYFEKFVIGRLIVDTD